MIFLFFNYNYRINRDYWAKYKEWEKEKLNAYMYGDIPEETKMTVLVSNRDAPPFLVITSGIYISSFPRS